MAISLQDVPELPSFLVPNVRPTGRSLGHGAYCSVEEVELLGAFYTCAAKKIHNTLLRMGSPDEVRNMTAKFVEECQLMSSLRHPHIVQFMGICFLPGSRVPVLIMEKLFTCVDELLERNPNIPLSIKRNILHDVAQGLAYLHSQSPPVIHRDLTAKNVLLNSSMVAKIADLGVARIVDIQPGQLAATMTQAPGTIVYMPPEALEPRARYGTKIDIFSLGNLAMYVLTQIFPELLASTYYRHHRIVARSEIERRFEYIRQIRQQLGSQHPLVQMVEQCLHNNPWERPSIGDILRQLEQARALIVDQYGEMNKLEMVQQLQCKDGQIGNLQTEVQTKSQQLQTQQQQLQFKDRHIRNLQAEVEEKKAESRLAVQALQVTEREIQQQREQLLSKDGQIRNLQAKVRTKRQQLQTQQQQLQFKDRHIRNLQAEVEAKEGESQRAVQALQVSEREIQQQREQLLSKDGQIRNLQAKVQTKSQQLQTQQQQLQFKDHHVRNLQAEVEAKGTENQQLTQRMRNTESRKQQETTSKVVATPNSPVVPRIPGKKRDPMKMQCKQTASPSSAAPLPVDNPERFSVREKIALFKNKQTSSPENSSQQQARPQIPKGQERQKLSPPTQYCIQGASDTAIKSSDVAMESSGMRKDTSGSTSISSLQASRAKTAPSSSAAPLPVDNPERFSVREKIALFKNKQTSSPENSSQQQARPQIPKGQDRQKLSPPTQYCIQGASSDVAMESSGKRKDTSGSTSISSRIASLQASRAKTVVDPVEVHTHVALWEQRRLSAEGSSRHLARVIKSSTKRPQQLRVPLSLKWRRGRNMPIAMKKAKADILNGRVYIGGGLAARNVDEYIMQVYSPERDEWTQLPQCPVKWFAMARVNHQLLLAGGRKRSTRETTNQITVWDSHSQQWIHPYPAMPTARVSASAIGYQQFLIVADGFTGMLSNVVEVLNTSTSQWHTVEPLPISCNWMTSALLGDTLYLLGGRIECAPTKTALTAHLSALISQTVPPSIPTWEMLPDVPVVSATAVVLHNSLLAVGGCSGHGGEHRSDIHFYAPSTRQWTKVGDLPTGLGECTCTELPCGELLILGGLVEGGKKSNCVYIGTADK